MSGENKVFIVVDNDVNRSNHTTEVLQGYGKVYEATLEGEIESIKAHEKKIDCVFVATTIGNLKANCKKIMEISGAELYVMGNLETTQIAEFFSIGVRDILTYPIYPNELGFEKKARVAPEIKKTSHSSTEVNFGASIPITRERIYLVCSPKGGEGKTSLAVQLGAVIRKVTGADVLLIDADHNGNVTRWCNTESVNSIAEFEKSDDGNKPDKQLDRDILESKLVTTESGMKILASPVDIFKGVHTDMILRALQAYKPFYSVIIVDMQPGFTPALAALKDYVTDIIMVTSNEYEKLERTREMAQRIRALNFDPSRVRVVANKLKDKDLQPLRVALKDNNFSITALPYSTDFEKQPKKVLPCFENPKKSSYSKAFRGLLTELKISKEKKQTKSEGKSEGFFSKLLKGRN